MSQTDRALSSCERPSEPLWVKALFILQVLPSKHIHMRFALESELTSKNMLSSELYIYLCLQCCESGLWGTVDDVFPDFQKRLKIERKIRKMFVSSYCIITNKVILYESRSSSTESRVEYSRRSRAAVTALALPTVPLQSTAPEHSRMNITEYIGSDSVHSLVCHCDHYILSLTFDIPFDSCVGYCHTKPLRANQHTKRPTDRLSSRDDTVVANRLFRLITRISYPVNGSLPSTRADPLL